MLAPTHPPRNAFKLALLVSRQLKLRRADRSCQARCVTIVIYLRAVFQHVDKNVPPVFVGAVGGPAVCGTDWAIPLNVELFNGTTRSVFGGTGLVVGRFER
eukprot:6176149-Pleurochrysis_carterae.AAC.1